MRRIRRFVVNSYGRNADLVNWLHRAVSRLWPATAVDARNVSDALTQILACTRDGERIGRVEFWGHGRPGAILVGDEELTVESFTPDSPHYLRLASLRDRLTDNAVVWFRGCRTFAGADGKNFARAAVAFFRRGITVVGQTRLLGYNFDWGGSVQLRPGREPTWKDIDPRDLTAVKEGNGLSGRLTRLWRRVAESWPRRYDAAREL
jgi:hypothetical protein